MKTKIALEDTFGDIIRKASAGTSISTDQLSNASGVVAGRINDFMADKALPSDGEAQKIATVLSLDPAKLADSGAGRWYPDDFTPPAYLGHQINAPHPSNGYFLVLRDHNVAAFVDPAGRPSSIIDVLKKTDVELQYLLLTHKHLDHSDALAAVRQAFPKAKPVIHELDGQTLGGAARDALAVSDGATLPFGDDAISMLYTPGHTDGSSCFLYKGMVFTGDTLFAGSVGRIFGERFGYEDLLSNIRTKIFALPADTAVLPGHGPPSTIEQEIRHNPFF